MKNLTKLFCLLLVFSMALTVTACKPGDKTPSGSGDTVSEAPKELVPHLGKRDLGGFTLTILGMADRNTSAYDQNQYVPEGIVNESVNDAVYNRNQKIEQEFNCKIKLLTYEKLGDVNDKLREVIATEQPDFQIVSGGLFDLSKFASEGHLYDFRKLPNSNLKLDGDWWDQAAIRDISLANVLPFITGDIAVTDNEATWAVYFNKKLIEDNELENPFDLVKNNEWTIDKMGEMAKKAYKDADGDQQMTVTGGDHWGMVAQTYDGLAFMWGATQPMITKDINDIPVFRVSDNLNVDTWNKVFELLTNREYTAMSEYFYGWNDPARDVVWDNFIEGRVLFRPGDIAFVNSEKLREAEQLSYGILPMPKYDKTQPEYSSSCTVYWATFLTIPKVVSADILDKTSFVVEAMAYLGKEVVTPQYYDVTLKNKRVQDEDSPEMLELIFKNRTFDLSAIYNWGDAIQFYTSIIGAKNNDISSRWDSYKEKYETAMQTTIEYFKSLAEE